jgi:hypothetical protein
MVTRGIREFMARDWGAVRASKDRYWADRIGRLGAIEALRIAEELRQQAALQDPAWPDDRSRHDDLQSHIHLAERLRRAGAARRASAPTWTSRSGSLLMRRNASPER